MYTNALINEAGCPWERGFRDPCTDDGEYPQENYDCEAWDTRDEYDLDRELREEARCKGGW